jgi:hypothetical protein
VSEELSHAGLAALVAPFVGLAFAAILDWITTRKRDAVVHGMLHRCVEGVLGGAIEGYLVAMILVQVSGH